MIFDTTEEMRKRGLDWKEDQMERMAWSRQKPPRLLKLPEPSVAWFKPAKSFLIWVEIDKNTRMNKIGMEENTEGKDENENEMTKKFFFLLTFQARILHPFQWSFQPRFQQKR